MSTRDQAQGIPGVLQDLRTLVVAYVKQETVDPVKDLGRFVGLGLAGVVVGSVGGIFLLLAGIRALQAEADSIFNGNLSFLPYVFALLACGLVAGMAAKALGGGKGDHDRGDGKKKKKR